ncbi:MAG: hypothetical protein ACXVCN_04960 [Bdellovibrio sp.]
MTDQKMSPTGVIPGTYFPLNFAVNEVGRITNITSWNPYQAYTEVDDFLSAIVASSLGWLSSVNGGGATVASDNTTINTTEQAIGVMALSTGTSSTGRASLYRGIDQIQIGICALSQSWRVKIPTLPDAINNFQVAIGLHDNIGAGVDATDGVYFKIDRSISTSNWICTTSKASTRTNQITNIPVSTNYVNLRIDINSQGTQIDFYINNVLAMSISTNIPNASGQINGPLSKIVKSAGLINRQLLIDLHAQILQWSSAR